MRGASAAALGRLPGRRLIFTNADAVHTRRVVERLGLTGLFDDVFHIGSAAFEPKPSALFFLSAIIEAYLLNAPRAPGLLRGLRTKPGLGRGNDMDTVLVGAARRRLHRAFRRPSSPPCLASAPGRSSRVKVYSSEMAKLALGDLQAEIEAGQAASRVVERRAMRACCRPWRPSRLRRPDARRGAGGWKRSRRLGGPRQRLKNRASCWVALPQRPTR